MLLAQLERFPQQHLTRNENALYLNGELAKLPGVYSAEARSTNHSAGLLLLRRADRRSAVRSAARRDQSGAGGRRHSDDGELSGRCTRSDAFKAAEAALRRAIATAPLAGLSRSLDLPVASITAATTLWFKHQMLMGTRDDAADVVEALAKIHANATSCAADDERTRDPHRRTFGRRSAWRHRPIHRLRERTAVVERRTARAPPAARDPRGIDGHRRISRVCWRLKAIPTTVVGLGGGSALDTAKFIAWKTGKRLIQIPSITSVDAGFTDAIGVRERRTR